MPESIQETASLRVETLAAGDEQAWDDFVQSHPQGTFFHLSGWRHIIGDVLGHDPWYLYAKRGGAIEGVLPLARIKSTLFGDALISVPFCVYGGICASTPEARSALLREAEDLASRLRTGHLELRNMAQPEAGWQTTDLYVTFRRELNPDPDVNFKAIPRKQRAMVRKGMQNGLESHIDDDTGRFYAAYSESLRNLGTPVLPRRYYAALKEIFDDRCEILTVTQRGRPVCSVLSFYFKDEVLPYYGGGGVLARSLKGNDFMYWELMRRAVEKGVRVFDYGRSKRGTGSYHFKKNWGFEPQPLHYSYKLVAAERLPDNNPLNPKYALFIKFWRKLPLAASRLLGPLLARQLG